MMRSKWPSRPRCNDVALDSGRRIRSLFGQERPVRQISVHYKAAVRDQSKRVDKESGGWQTTSIK